MHTVEQMLKTYPKDLGGIDSAELTRTIQALIECAQACTACADACSTTANILSRHAEIHEHCRSAPRPAPPARRRAATCSLASIDQPAQVTDERPQLGGTRPPQRRVA